MDRRTGRFHPCIHSVFILSLGRRCLTRLTYQSEPPRPGTFYWGGTALFTLSAFSFSAERTGIFSTGNEEGHLFHKEPSLWHWSQPHGVTTLIPEALKSYSDWMPPDLRPPGKPYGTPDVCSLSWGPMCASVHTRLGVQGPSPPFRTHPSEGGGKGRNPQGTSSPQVWRRLSTAGVARLRLVSGTGTSGCMFSEKESSLAPLALRATEPASPPWCSGESA